MLVEDTMEHNHETKKWISSNSHNPRSSQKNNNWKLLQINQIPRHLRFNKYVLSHYRPETNWIGCVKSLFYLHNETVNILTHGKPFIEKCPRQQVQICIFVQNWWGHPVVSSLQWQMQNVNIQPKKKGNVGWQISLTHVRKPVSSLGLSAFSLLAEENTSGLLSLHVLRLLLRKAF